MAGVSPAASKNKELKSLQSARLPLQGKAVVGGQQSF